MNTRVEYYVKAAAEKLRRREDKLLHCLHIAIHNQKPTNNPHFPENRMNNELSNLIFSLLYDVGYIIQP